MTTHEQNNERSPLRILLAEDDEAIAKLFEMLLIARECEVVTAGNGREAVDLWQKSPFDLILVDLNMPKMNGYEVAKAIRDMEGQDRKRTPILGMSAHAKSEDQDRCHAAGMDGYLSKLACAENLYDLVLPYIQK